MREAVLGGVSALDARPPRGAAQARPTGASRRGKKLSPRLRRVRAHLALIVGSAGFSAIMIGIILNATVMQKEHHPAPLFGAATAPVRMAAAPPGAPSAAVSGLVPGPSPSTPTVLPAAAPAAPPVIAAAPQQNAAKASVRVPQNTVALRSQKPADGIARFLNGSRAVASAHAPARPVSTQPRAAASKLRPAIPVATRSEAASSAVN